MRGFSRNRDDLVVEKNPKKHASGLHSNPPNIIVIVIISKKLAIIRKSGTWYQLLRKHGHFREAVEFEPRGFFKPNFY